MHPRTYALVFCCDCRNRVFDHQRVRQDPRSFHPNGLALGSRRQDSGRTAIWPARAVVNQTNEYNAVAPQTAHPDLHTPWQQWGEDQVLHVAIAYSNPFRWETRRRLANNCIRHLRSSANVVLHVGELAYGDRPFEITTSGNPLDVQLRVDRAEMFSKENILQLVTRTFPQNYQYGAAVDADWHFTRHDWALETIQQLQHYKFVQMFSSYADLSGGERGEQHIPVRYNHGFIYAYFQNGFKVSPQYHSGFIGADGQRVTPANYATYEEAMKAGDNGTFMRGVGATGGAWAWRKSAFDTVGGFLDRCPVGHSDWSQTYSLVDVEPPDIHLQNYNPSYKHYICQFRERAQALLKNIGYVDCFCTHAWHGAKGRRAYSSRDIILAKHQFSPYEDLIPNHMGVYQLNPKKIGLRDDIRAYLLSRGEDNPNLGPNEKLLV